MEAIRGKSDVEKAVKSINAPISINVFDAIQGAKTTLIGMEDLKRLGVARVSMPVGTVFAATRGVKDYLEALLKRGVLFGEKELAISFDEWKALLEIDKIYTLEKKYL